jgi:hypothetical protein
MTWALMTLDFIPYHRLLSYLFLPLLVVAFSVWAGSILRRTMPSVYGKLTGGRGF